VISGYVYASTAEKLVQRILDVAEEHPEILELSNPWEMFQVPGFRCDDIGPSLAQAGWALVEAKQRKAAR